MAITHNGVSVNIELNTSSCATTTISAVKADDIIIFDIFPFCRLSLSLRQARDIADVLAICAYDESILALLGKRKVLYDRLDILSSELETKNAIIGRLAARKRVARR